ncbi:BUD protein [Ananas comosus]|uniref:BUD protein n=1 Tax=Ananas comosus TaxID=4615 RepID=A0A199UW07_ANACO|nr:BUD protein [Ananas comosus]
MAPASTSTAALSLKEYLKRYQSDADDPNKAKAKAKKKKRKSKPHSTGGVLVVDEDPVWQKPVRIEEDEADSPGEEQPQIDEDIEVKRMKRLEAIRARKPYHAIAEDGSGWVSVSDPSKLSDVAKGGGVGDLSPPRQPRARFDTPSPERSPDRPDLSPLRRQQKSDENVEYTPPPTRKLSEDLVPPRKGRGRIDSPPRRHVRHDSKEPPDISPPRSRRGDAKVKDMSPPRRKLPENLSPLRKGRRQVADGELLSPPRRRVRHDSEELLDRSLSRRSHKGDGKVEDMSPPRRKVSEDLSPLRKAWRTVATDRSPERKAGEGPPEDISPPWRHGPHDSEEPTDLSPPRRSQKGRAVDQSPSRKAHGSPAADLLALRRNRKDSSPDLSPPRRRKEVALGKEPPRAGLFSKQEFKEEIDKKREEQKSRFASIDPSKSGRGAEPVFRDKSGKIISKEELLKSKEDDKPKISSIKKSHDFFLKIKRMMETRDKKNSTEEPVEFVIEDLLTVVDQGIVAPDYKVIVNLDAVPRHLDVIKKRISQYNEVKLEWGKGLAQKREAEARALELEIEKDKPFARSRDDPDLDKMLKERIRWGDPMAHLVKRKNPEPILEDLGVDVKMKESGFIIPQTIPSHSWLKRGIDFPPNRYGIRPGRHWDGVDRSNGFEKELFKRQNEKQATEQEAFLWSVSDM